MVLTARGIEAARPGRHSDGAGLQLLVQPSGARSWVLRVQVKGVRLDVGLGGFPELSLARAREKAHEWRPIFKAGGDPRRAEAIEPARPIVTFKAAAEALISAKQPGWRSAKHAAQWGSTLA